MVWEYYWLIGSHIWAFSGYQKLATLSDLEQPCSYHYASFHTMQQIVEPGLSDSSQLDPYNVRQKYSPQGLVFGNAWFMEIFVVVWDIVSIKSDTGFGAHGRFSTFISPYLWNEENWDLQWLYKYFDRHKDYNDGLVRYLCSSWDSRFYCFWKLVDRIFGDA